jgi:M6 family metalloprotease-like protein
VRRGVALLLGLGFLALGVGLVRDVEGTEALAAPARTCASLAPTDADLSEGPPSAADAAVNVRSRGTQRAAVIFADFSDAPGSERPSEIVQDLLQPGANWLRTSSYGRFAVVLRPATRWVRMPHPAASYGYASTGDTHREYIADAIKAADPTFDFSQTDIVYVVAAKTNEDVIPDSPTFRGAPGAFVADGRKLGPAVTFGFDAYTYGRTILPHETGHLLGLPDLYAANGDDIHRFAGTWDLMGNVFQATDLSAWHRLKLGWIDPAQIVCAPRGVTTTAELTALGANGGRKAVFVRTGNTTGLLVENRQRVANDGSICDRGALVYTVDSSIDSGSGPVKVVGSTGDCGYGPSSKAPLHVGESIRVGRVQVAVTRSRGTHITVRVAVP